MKFTATKIKATAIEKVGLDDFGSSHSDQALEAWVEDLHHPRLNENGRALFSSLMVGDLTRRLRVIDCLKKNPEIERVKIPDILYISGLERTGTTFLHNLLSLPNDARAMLRWELMRPTPPPQAVTYATDPRIAATQAPIDKLRGTMLERMHWVNADDPEECQWGMIDGSSMLGASAFAIMPNWAEWYTRRNIETGFHEYRQVLKLLLWKNQLPTEGRLVLKCPQFSDRLSAFADVFPEASFAILHRDPYRVVVSLCTMLTGILSPFLADLDSLKSDCNLVRLVTERIEARLPKIAAFVMEDRSLANIAYPDLVQSPSMTARAVYEGLGFNPPHDFDAMINAYITAQKRGRRARPPQELPTHGLDHNAFLSRPIIADYCQRFKIEPERQRKTGA